MTATDQPLKQLQQHRHVIEVKSRGWFIEDKQISAWHRHPAGRKLAGSQCHDVLCFAQMTDQFETLGFTTGKGVERLPQSQVPEPDFLKHAERFGQGPVLADLCKKFDRFAYGELEQIVD